MTKKYDVEFKKQLVHAYMQGASYSQLQKEYGIAKSTISGWVKKYSEESRYTSKSQSDHPYAKEIHAFNLSSNAYYNYLKGNKTAYHRQKQKVQDDFVN